MKDDDDDDDEGGGEGIDEVVMKVWWRCDEGVMKVIFDLMTDRQTNGRTLVVVESLSLLKI